MKENLNLEEILKGCPKGTKLYSPICGEVEFVEILSGCDLSIKTISKTYNLMLFCKNGQYLMGGECVLFPSKDQRDWSKFQQKKPKDDEPTEAYITLANEPQVQPKKEIDWGQRRYEIARDILASCASAELLHYNALAFAQEAIEIADVLIKELKGGEQ